MLNEKQIEVKERNRTYIWKIFKANLEKIRTTNIKT